MNNEPMPEFLTIAQVAGVLQVGLPVIRSLCRRRTLRALKIGNEWRIDKASLHTYLHQQLYPTSRFGGR